jgi:hypothetical protein
MTIVMVAMTGVILGFSNVAGAEVPPIVLFTTTNNAMWGWVVKTTADSQQQSATITPLAPTTVDASGNEEANLTNATRSIFGVEAYNFTNVTDLTVNIPSGVQDSGQTTTNIGNGGSLLGGLITWNQNNVTLMCSVDAHIPLQINCGVTDYTEGLTINGVAVAPGYFPQGTSFPVAGPIDDSQCSSGSETFSGTLTPQELNILGNETTRPTIVLTGLHLVGDATCSSSGTGILFSTHYDLTVGNHTLAQHEKSGVGNLDIVFTGSEYSIFP